MQGNPAASSLDVLSSALDLARVGLARWDTDDRLVTFNNTYRSLVYSNQQDEVRLGRKFAIWRRRSTASRPMSRPGGPWRT
jgi:hypothetical protein